MAVRISNARARELGIADFIPANAKRGPVARGEFTEAAVLRDCLALLKLRGISAARNNTGAAKFGRRLVRFGQPGASDILGTWKFRDAGPRMLAVECKRPKSPGRSAGRLTTAQWDYLRDVRDCGGVALVVRSVGELAAALDRLAADPAAVFDLPPRPEERKATAKKRRSSHER